MEDRQNKIRTALDDMQELPEGISFNSNRVWNDVEQQIPRRKNERPFFYYAAAAIVLMAGVGSWVWFVKKSPAQQEPSTTTVQGPLPAGLPQKDVVAISQDVHIKSRVALAKTMAVRTKHEQRMEMDQQEPIAPHNIEEKITMIPESISAPVATAPIVTEEKKKPVLTAAKKPVVRPYRIIHLNDLDVVASPTPQAGSLSKSELKKILQQQEDKETEHTPDNNTRSYLPFKKSTNTSTLSLQENN